MAGLGSAHQFLTLRQPMQSQGCLIHHIWRTGFKNSAELDEFMMRYLMVKKGVLGSIIGFCAVDACMICHYLTKLCCQEKIVKIQKYVLRGEKSVYGISFYLVHQ